MLSFLYINQNGTRNINKRETQPAISFLKKEDTFIFAMTLPCLEITIPTECVLLASNGCLREIKNNSRIKENK